MFRSAVTKTARLFAKLPQNPRLKNVQARQLFTMDSDGFDDQTAPFTSVYRFFKDTLLPLGFRSDEEITVFDVHCGTGFLTKELIVPMYPNMKRAFAIDPVPESIQMAKERNQIPKVEYNQGNIADWNSVMVWDGVAHKLFALYSLQWVQDQPQAFRNIRQILQPGGEAAIYMVLNSMFYRACEKVRHDNRWSSYFKDVGEYVAVAHKNGYTSDYYRNLVKELGFSIMYCEEKVESDKLQTPQMFKEFFASLCVLTEYVPFEKRLQFKDDLFHYMVRDGGNNVEGNPIHVGTMMELVIRKEKQ